MCLGSEHFFSNALCYFSVCLLVCIATSQDQPSDVGTFVAHSDSACKCSSSGLSNCTKGHNCSRKVGPVFASCLHGQLHSIQKLVFYVLISGAQFTMRVQSADC